MLDRSCACADFLTANNKLTITSNNKTAMETKVCKKFQKKSENNKPHSRIS
jgi:hypothetical protein